MVSFGRLFNIVTSITRRKDVIAICRVIDAGYFRALITLDFQCCSFPPSSHADSRMTDPNTRLLLEAIRSGNCPRLEILRLSNNAVGVAGSTALAKCLAQGVIPSIRHIDVQRLEESAS